MILFNFCSFHWLLPWILPFLLGLLAGWALWWKWKGMYADLEAKVNGYKSKITGLEADLTACRAAKSELDGEIALHRGRVREMEVAVKEAEASAKSSGGGNNDAEISGYKTTISKLEADLAACKAARTGLEGELASAKSAAASVKNAGIDAASLASGFAAGVSTGGDSDSSAPAGTSGNSSSIYSSIKEDNLQIIEGIGPKMESVLKDNGVKTLAQLGGKTTPEVQAILGKYGDKYKIIDPKTWVQQAGLAAGGKWEQLIDLQKRLDTGVDNAKGMTDSKLEKYMIKKGLLRAYKQDDLKAVEGIGPAIEKLMHAAGINTWRSMADSSVERLKGLLDDAGSRFKLADPGTWPTQAGMAADGKFKELQEYQDFLQGGK